MINITNLGDIRPILISGKGNPEIVKLVRKYFNDKPPVYRGIVKYYWYEIHTNNNAKYFFQISLKEYEDIKYKIFIDVMNLVQDYYIARKKKYSGIKKVSDLITYKKRDTKNLKKWY